MKKPRDIEALTATLTQAATAPLVALTETEGREETPRAPAMRRKAPTRSTVSVFLRISQALYERYDEEAVRRTKATGRGVTVQQVMLDRLAAEDRA